MKGKKKLFCSDHDIGDEQQALLLILANRTCSLPLGRAFWTFGTAKPTLTEAVPIPSIEISARLPPVAALVQLDLSSLQKNFMDCIIYLDL